MWILGVKGVKGSLNVSPSSTGLLITKGMELPFCPKVVTQSLN